MFSEGRGVVMDLFFTLEDAPRKEFIPAECQSDVGEVHGVPSNPWLQGISVSSGFPRDEFLRRCVLVRKTKNEIIPGRKLGVCDSTNPGGSPWR